MRSQITLPDITLPEIQFSKIIKDKYATDVGLAPCYNAIQNITALCNQLCDYYFARCQQSSVMLQENRAGTTKREILLYTRSIDVYINFSVEARESYQSYLTQYADDFKKIISIRIEFLALFDWLYKTCQNKLEILKKQLACYSDAFLQHFGTADSKPATQTTAMSKQKLSTFVNLYNWSNPPPSERALFSLFAKRTVPVFLIETRPTTIPFLKTQCVD